MNRPVPFDVDAETSLLGAMLLSRTAITTALDLVGPEDLYVPWHRQVFAAIDLLHAQGQPTDVVTVAARLAGARDAKNRLLELQAQTPASANAGGYARIVADRAYARKAIAHGEALTAAGYTQDRAVLDTLVSTTEEVLRPSFGTVTTLDLDELVAMADQDELHPIKPWVIPGLLRLLEPVVITGAEGLGKALLMRQIGVCKASGLHPFTFLAEGMTAGPVLYVDLQEPEIDIAYEVRRLRRAVGDHYRPGWFRVVSRKQGVNLTSPHGQRWLESVIRDHQPVLVLMGPIVRMYSSTSRRSRHDEDLVDELTMFLDELMVRYQFALILEGHAGNDRSDAEAWRVRGSSVWRSWPAFGFGMKPISLQPREAEMVRWRIGRYGNRAWPEKLLQGSRLPWEPNERDYERMVRIMGLGYLIDGAQQDAGF